VNYSTFTLRPGGPILRVTLKNPSINLMSLKMIEELFQLTGQLVTDQQTKVVIIDSADPDFFIAHVDLEDLATSAANPEKASKYPDINALQALALSWQALPQATIAKIAGRCRGGGLEFILGLSMRFATEDSLFCSPEAAGGFLACGGGTTRIGMMAGPARALEFLLSARDFTGVEAERYGLVNRALPANELDAYVDALAQSIARRSRAVIGMHQQVFKKTFSAAVEPMFAGFAQENDCLRTALAGAEMQAAMKAHLAAGQTRENELDLPALMTRTIPPQ
jgi:enoyl-CoA hydratase/carnithine racemase